MALTVTHFQAVERAVRTGAPHELLSTVRDALIEHFEATEVDLLVADYGSTVLQPVTALPHTAQPLAIKASPRAVLSSARSLTASTSLRTGRWSCICR